MPDLDHDTSTPSSAGLPGRLQARSREPSVPARAEVVRSADAYLRARLDRSVSMDALSRAIGVSTRTLHRRFRLDLGVSPAAYGKALRLTAARGDLSHLGPGQTISEIAMRRGFTHLGYFSVDYRRLFGERPSETVHQALARTHRAEHFPPSSGAHHETQ